MAAVELGLEDLEKPCLWCLEHPGKKLDSEGKWVGDKCEPCKGTGYLPTRTGEAVLLFLDRHRPREVTPS